MKNDMFPILLGGGVILALLLLRNKRGEQPDYRDTPAGLSPELVAGIIASQQRQ